MAPRSFLNLSRIKLRSQICLCPSPSLYSSTESFIKDLWPYPPAAAPGISSKAALGRIWRSLDLRLATASRSAKVLFFKAGSDGVLDNQCAFTVVEHRSKAGDAILFGNAGASFVHPSCANDAAGIESCRFMIDADVGAGLMSSSGSTGGGKLPPRGNCAYFSTAPRKTGRNPISKRLSQQKWFSAHFCNATMIPQSVACSLHSMVLSNAIFNESKACWPQLERWRKSIPKECLRNGRTALATDSCCSTCCALCSAISASNEAAASANRGCSWFGAALLLIKPIRKASMSPSLTALSETSLEPFKSGSNALHMRACVAMVRFD
mmetsp:Transcript_9325/g.16837  ORF Transcript_9325/g.16837 Transcript_9325/m.16837 type:complete len:323 (+) Transcript_9325:200-1168(+)